MPASGADVRYRRARPDDAPALAALHADSWRRHYRGMFPDDYLDHEADADRAKVWHDRLHSPDPAIATITLVAERDDGELAGFGHSIVDEDARFGTLLDNLHVRHSAQRLGIGRRLMAETARALVESGNDSPLYLWVLEGNAQARGFYAALGGQDAGAGTSSDGGSSAPALRILWSDPSVLWADGAEGGPAAS